MKLPLVFRAVLVSGALIACCAGAIRSQAGPTDAPPSEYHNLKVLPRNITSKDLQRIMVDEFNEGLGVGCGFCHAEKPGSHSLDYASDAKSEKNIARMMIKMTLGLDKKYFQVHKPMIGDPALAVTCTTCHRGLPHPDTGAGQ
ncbi:MAG: c-type cytochrome [Bacteroidota bacterium]|nr:c-type cytochrome [Bacteroidota bacterium]MDP4246063.1 c-type cytochrome [Bacteroidota bacterium]MDP4255266.1 c-type cytochrome [Bacteroidota bacterium]MDP4258810.1 c-type cytochrome [Bacteroidota bacterium]